jgi:thioredoxin 1
MKHLIAILILSSGFVTPALALDKESFTEARFSALQAAGEVILVDVFADWCPTCARQQKIIEQYRSENPHRQFHVLEVDFDNDKEQVRRFRAPRQSTLLLYHGAHQFWFSVGETRPEVIFAELEKVFAAAEKAPR